MKHIEIGTPVIHTAWSDIYPYKGEGDSEFTRVAIGANPGIEAAVTEVAPAAEVEVNLKDPRIKDMVINNQTTPTRERPKWKAASFKWLAESVALDFHSWHKTKRDAVAECARRLAIHDWHNGEGA